MPQITVEKVGSTTDRTLPVFGEFEQLAERIRLEAYNLFARRGAGDGHALDDWLTAEREVCWPAAKLSERDGGFVLEVALAGFEPGEVSVTATPREIIAKAVHEHAERSDKDGGKLQFSEFRSDNVLRRVELPASVDVSRVEASLKNGILTIAAPRAVEEESAPSRIPVTSGS